MVIYEALGGLIVAGLIVLGIFKFAEIWKGRNANAKNADETVSGTNGDCHE